GGLGNNEADRMFLLTHFPQAFFLIELNRNQIYVKKVLATAEIGAYYCTNSGRPYIDLTSILHRGLFCLLVRLIMKHKKEGAPSLSTPTSSKPTCNAGC